MDCQSGCPLKALISLISEEPTWIRRALPRAVPQCGQRGDVSRALDMLPLSNIAIPIGRP